MRQERDSAGGVAPHSTHRLQPLDVGIFSPLAHIHSQEIDQLIQSSGGFLRLTKRGFWRLFAVAWEGSVTSNFKLAFAGPGIFPLEPEKVLRLVMAKIPSLSNSDNDLKKAKSSAERCAQTKRCGEDLRTPGLKRRKIAMPERAEAPGKASPKQKQASKNRSTAVNSSVEVCGSGGHESGHEGQDWRVSRAGRKIGPPRQFLD